LNWVVVFVLYLLLGSVEQYEVDLVLMLAIHLIAVAILEQPKM
jgi:hypothetical protein